MQTNPASQRMHPQRGDSSGQDSMFGQDDSRSLTPFDSISRYEPSPQPAPRTQGPIAAARVRYASQTDDDRPLASSYKSNASLGSFADDSSSFTYAEKEKSIGEADVVPAPSFLSVPAPRRRQAAPSSSDDGSFIGGFGDPTARLSSALSVTSSASDREATSEAWIRRQRIKPGRAKTKKVKLTKGRFIADYGESSCFCFRNGHVIFVHRRSIRCSQCQFGGRLRSHDRRERAHACSLHGGVGCIPRAHTAGSLRHHLSGPATPMTFSQPQATP